MKKNQSNGPLTAGRNRKHLSLLRGKESGRAQGFNERRRPGTGSGLRGHKGVAVLPKAKNRKVFRLHGGDLNGSERHEISSPKQVDDHCTRAGAKLFLAEPLLFSKSSGILRLLRFDEDASLRSSVWGGSSAGRALRSQCRGREFDPPPLHHRISKVSRILGFSGPFCCVLSEIAGNLLKKHPRRNSVNLSVSVCS